MKWEGDLRAMAREPNETACVNCSNALRRANGGEAKPPCMEAHQYANAHHRTTLMVFDAAVIGGGPCAWHAELEELRPLIVNRNYLLHNPQEVLGGHSAKLASGILAAMAEHAKSSLNQYKGSGKIADDLGYVSKNGQRVIEWDGGKTNFLILIAQPNENAWIAFSEKFKHKVTNHGQYDRGTKYLMAIEEAGKTTKGEMGEFLKSLTGENVGKAIVIFGLFAGISGAMISAGGLAKVLALIVGAGMDAALFLSCANNLIRFVSAIEKATSPEEIAAAARYLAHFCQEFAGLVGLNGAAFLLNRRKKLCEWFLKRKKKEWTEAAQVTKPKPHVPGSAEAAAGMWRWHLDGWTRWSKKNHALVVLRAGNPNSLVRHFDELVTGKPMFVKWKTAKSGPHIGLVVVPKPDANATVAKIAADIDKLLAAGYKFVPKPKKGMRPGAGDLLIAPDGRAMCGDVDKMGIYLINPKTHQAPSLEEARRFNDDPGMTERLQREVYGGGAEMDHHPGQDFYYKEIDANGKPKMLLDPGEKEKFVVFEPPEGKSKVVDLEGLKAIYKQYGVGWHYNV